MSISSLLTTVVPPSPTIPHAAPSSSSRHSNIQLTASSSRPQRRKTSMDIPPPPMPLLPTKKRKREGDTPETEVIPPLPSFFSESELTLAVSSHGKWQISQNQVSQFCNGFHDRGNRRRK